MDGKKKEGALIVFLSLFVPFHVGVVLLERLESSAETLECRNQMIDVCLYLELLWERRISGEIDLTVKEIEKLIESCSNLFDWEGVLSLLENDGDFGDHLKALGMKTEQLFLFIVAEFRDVFKEVGGKGFK